MAFSGETATICHCEDRAISVLAGERCCLDFQVRAGTPMTLSCCYSEASSSTDLLLRFCCSRLWQRLPQQPSAGAGLRFASAHRSCSRSADGEVVHCLLAYGRWWMVRYLFFHFRSEASGCSLLRARRAGAKTSASMLLLAHFICQLTSFLIT